LQHLPVNQFAVIVEYFGPGVSFGIYRSVS
jgi:hypothetical protein